MRRGELKWEGLLPFQWGGFHEGRRGHGVGVGGLDLWVLVGKEKKVVGYFVWDFGAEESEVGLRKSRR